MKKSDMEAIVEDIIDHGMYLGSSFAQIAENILHIQMKNGMLPPETRFKHEVPQRASGSLILSKNEWEDES